MLSIAAWIGNTEEKHPLTVAGNLGLIDPNTTGDDINFLAGGGIIAAEVAECYRGILWNLIINVYQVLVTAEGKWAHHGGTSRTCSWAGHIGMWHRYRCHRRLASIITVDVGVSPPLAPEVVGVGVVLPELPVGEVEQAVKRSSRPHSRTPDRIDAR